MWLNIFTSIVLGWFFAFVPSFGPLSEGVCAGRSAI